MFIVMKKHVNQCTDAAHNYVFNSFWTRRNKLRLATKALLVSRTHLLLV